MPKIKNKVYKLRYTYLQAIGIVLILLLVVLLLWQGNVNSYQSTGAIMAQVRFEGEYRIADGPWQKIVDGEHIPATKGDVTLRGNFHLLTPDGEYIGIYDGDIPIAMYTDHISLTICEGENEPYVMDMENPLFGVVSCGINWMAHTFSNAGPIEILIHNPHRIGNETAIDELLANTALWANIDFEKSVLDSGQSQRNMGLFFVIVALALLGIALFSTLMHIKKSKLLWLFGLVILFAGIYFTYSASGVSFWSDSRVTNTIAAGSSMMLYMLFLSMAIVYCLTFSKKVGMIVIICLSVADALFFALPMITDLYFYDTLFYWIVTQLIANVILLGCLVKDCSKKRSKRNWCYIGAIFPLIAFGVDVIMTVNGSWKGGILSGYTFVVLFAAAMVIALRIIPHGINVAARAKELETEKTALKAQLAESRISIMLSQIQPHFIYNTLGTIERMCLKDPQKAFELVRNFSMYLRGNFSELDSVTPIRFAEELKHVEYYVNIEKVRFPDMNIEYDVEVTEFVLPALSVQPLVENAIKHGLMRLETGGTVKIHSYETLTHFCVEVTDDGVGFDTEAPIDEKKHVGLRNIRGRLKAMVNGALILESKPGVGTKAMIMIPKEVTA